MIKTGSIFALLFLLANFANASEAVKAAYQAYLVQMSSVLAEARSACKRVDAKICEELSTNPPKPLATGYQVLPKLKNNLPYAEKPRKTGVQKSYYSWPRTLQFIEREVSIVSECKEKLKALARLEKVDAKIVLKKTIQDIVEIQHAQSTIDEHVKYNDFWQSRIQLNTGAFEKANTALARLEANPSVFSPLDAFEVKPPPFLKNVSGKITVPVYTDIKDRAFLSAFKNAIETEWRTARHSVHLDIRRFPAASKLSDDLNLHIDRFPKDGAVLTTGAPRSFERSGRAIVLGPESLTPRELAHKFGHILGFPDFYIRGFRSLGKDGFEIIEAVVSSDDIMAEPQKGRVSENHFTALKLK